MAGLAAPLLQLPARLALALLGALGGAARARAASAARKGEPRASRGAACTALVVHPRFLWQLRAKPGCGRRPSALPDEVVTIVLSFLEAADLCRSAKVCKQWYFLSYTDIHWQRLVLLRYSVDPFSIIEFARGELCARTLYMRVRLRQRALLKAGQCHNQFGHDAGFERSPIAVRAY
jgi:hypothetical protein